MNKILVAFISLFIYLNAHAQKEKIKIESLQGTWLSIDDSKSTIIIKQYKQFSSYAGEIISQDDFNLYDTCMNYASPKDEKYNVGNYLIVFDEGDNLYYSIDGIANNKLTLFYEGSEKLLTYKKIN